MGVAGKPMAWPQIRRATARRMTESKHTIPHFYVTADIEMETAVAALAQLNREVLPEQRISMMAAILKAVDLALDEHPRLNSRWEGEDLLVVDEHNLGVAIAIPDGLVAPALVGCNGRSVPDLAMALKDLVFRTRSGRLRPAEINDATFTCTNLGSHGVTSASTRLRSRSLRPGRRRRGHWSLTAQFSLARS